MNLLVKAGATAAAGLAVLLAAGCAAGRPAAAGPGQAHGTVQACTAFGVRAIEDHRTVTQVPAACRGLSRSEVNFALGRSIYLVAASGHHKVAWRHDAAVAGTRLARLITTAMAAGASASPAVAGAAGSRPGPVDRRPLGLAALATWLLTVGSGGYMLLRFVLGGGLRRQRAAGDRTGPAVVLTHFGLASSGLLLWAVYLAASWLWLAWVAVGLLLPVIGFGMATLIVWTTGAARSRAAASSRTPGPSDAPSGTSPPGAGPSPAGAGPSLPGAGPSPAGAGPSLPGAGPSPAGAEPSLPGAGMSPAGAEASPAGAGPSLPGPPGPAASAGAPAQVQLAEASNQEPAGQPAPRQRPSRWLIVIIPIIHGLLASATILLALLTALGPT